MKGGRGDGVNKGTMQLTGLGCVTVLIGTFVRLSGDPVVGVINQPFWKESGGGGWEGRAVWGVACGGRTLSNVPLENVRCDPSAMVIISEVEPRSVVDTLRQAGWEVLTAAGAGYKLLCVVDGLVDCYLATPSCTYKWDTCGPHAVLKALGGNVVTWRETRRVREADNSLTYHHPDDPTITGGQRWRNASGILAYRDPQKAQEIVDAFL